ncbi:MAG: sugar phosphate isomerase/epimerase family protein [Haloarculaceae archaeon]
MRYALNQMAFPRDDLEANVDLLAAAGYEGIEPNLTADGPLWDDDAVASLADRVDEAGLDVPAVSTTLHWEYPLSSPDTETREEGIAAGERMIAVADALDADDVLIVPALVGEDTPYDDAYERGLDAVRRLAETAADHGVTVAVENVWNDFLYSPLEYRSFVDEAGEAGPVGAYFDVGNVRRFGRPEQWIDLLGDRIERVHVKDYDTDIDTIEGFTYPLQGDLDWPAIADALDRIGYDDWITAEVPPYETYPEQMPPQVLSNLRRAFE